MGDRTAATLLLAAAAAWCGALVASPVPLGLGAALAAAAVLVARATWGRALATVLGVVAVGLLTTTMADRAESGAAPIEPRSHTGTVTLLSDPERFGPSVRADVRVGGARVEAWARGSAAARLGPRLAGERVVVVGTLAPPPPDAPWLRVRHVRGRMTIHEVEGWSPGHLPSRAANGLRRTLDAGASSMGDAARSLFLGLVLGDDRGQTPQVVDDFRGSGLSHLLAVSGSNVAFVLALAAPLLAGTTIPRRLVATLLLLGFFALLTRFEPSVLRATVMAGSSAVAVAAGRAADARRILPLAVVLLLLVDPFLARSLAFRLSTAASAGIIWWSGRLALALPGPRPVAAALAVTGAAQLAVAPFLLSAFGPMPVASLPANLLAGPAAGLTVVWGLPAGLLAGLVGPPLDAVLHLPTRLAVGWIQLVAERAAALPLGELTARHVVVVAGAAAVLAAARGHGRSLAGVVLAVALVHPGWVAQRAGDRTAALGPGATLHIAEGAVVVVLDADVRVDALLEGLRRQGVGEIDVVVARHGGARAAEAVAVLHDRARPRLVLAPEGHRIPGGAVPAADSRVLVGALTIEVADTSPQLEVTVSSVPVPRPRGPPPAEVPSWWVAGRRAAARRPWRSSPPRRRTRRRSCRPGRSTTTRGAGHRLRSPGRTASRRCAPRRGAVGRRTSPRSPLGGG
ncbi:hypothetical protein GH723_11525 [Actinomarinicola tropica]|uniref:ComEC/Rec2-related protein domain-containing protein n=1 Tax=Actinomarinicola tropica TaxID=2789776 RepID=A0A5Q2RMN1_9ACTN|nr:hypothetical protein GH723_11525 [Actinomarinicola tropica]